MEEFIGATEFERLTGADNFQVRLLEAAKVISPARCGRWRVFTKADVAAVLKHYAAEERAVSDAVDVDNMDLWSRLGSTT